jgi:hypothetical protein
MQKAKPKKLTISQELKKLQIRVNGQEEVMEKMISLLDDIKNARKANVEFYEKSFDRVWEAMRQFIKTLEILGKEIYSIRMRMNINKEEKSTNFWDLINSLLKLVTDFKRK